ncbi:hypothetical protein DKX38_017409 [Salix brachista]|uniref:PAS domain-containing protein n=1 Tax=Salix brachista TaxID=2182728 RepID=A0A5N5KV53_9ROSI|nr:hypothetical protein DKX38_017409 [Salix brachista]
MDLVKCDGAALYYHGQYYPLGVTPTESQIKDIVEWLLTLHGDPTGLSTDSLADAGYPGAAFLGDAVCGMAVAYIAKRDFLFWFRSHTVKEVKWSGAKHHPEDKDDGQRMHPRSSFKAFLEVVKSRSLPWENAEMDAIHSLHLILRDSFRDAEASNSKVVVHTQLKDMEFQGMDELTSVAREMVRLIETATAPIFAVDVDGRINGWNAKVAELIGLSVEEAMGKSLVHDIVYKEYEETVGKLLHRAEKGFEKATCIDTLMELQSGHPSMLNSGETLLGDANLCTHVQLLAPQIMRYQYSAETVVYAETDAGFNPTPSKTDLEHHNPVTIALKNFSHKTPEKEKVNVDISRDDKLLSPSHLEKEYEEWILEMHSQYDTEVGAGEDDGVLVVGPTNKIPGISSDVVRVRDTLTRKGTIWKRGQKIKVLKGAGPGFHNKNVYLTLEHILIEGAQGDAGGGACIICRPLDIAEENGCVLSVKDGELDIRSSISIPISVIDSGKCQTIESSEWNCQLQKQVQKAPSTIEVLGRKHCRELGIDGGFPAESTVEAGCAPPAEIVAVVRPVLYISSSHSKSLDQKYIAKTNLEMSIEVKIRKSAEECQNVGHIYSARIELLLLSDKNCKKYEKKVTVKASREVGKWKLLGDIQGKPRVRVGSPFPSFSIGCLDIYGNRIPFKSVPEITVKLDSIVGVLAETDKFKKSLSSDKLTLKVQNVLIVSNKLDRIQPKYEATLVICPVDELIKVSIPCQVDSSFMFLILYQLCPDQYSTSQANHQFRKNTCFQVLSSQGKNYRHSEVEERKLTRWLMGEVKKREIVVGLTNNLHELFKIRKPPKPKLKTAEVEKELSKIPTPPKQKSNAAEVEKEKRVLKAAEVEKELSKIPKPPKPKSKAAEVEKEKRVIVQALRKEPDLPTKIQKPKSKGAVMNQGDKPRRSVRTIKPNPKMLVSIVHVNFGCRDDRSDGHASVAPPLCLPSFTNQV